MSSFANPNDEVLTQPKTQSQLRSALQASKSGGTAGDVAAIEAVYVSATATFTPDNAVLRANGTVRGAQSSTAIVADTGALQLTNDSTLETSGSHAPVLVTMDSVGTAAFEVTAFTAASGNLAIGPNSGLNITTGVNNTFIGQESGLDATEGSYNVAIGRYSAWNLTTGEKNLFIGFNSGSEVRGGSYNTLIGQSAGAVMTEGLHNMAVGRAALSSVTTGSYNVCIGNSTLLNLETGEGNIAIGASSLGSTTASDNIGIGRSSGRSITSGGGNICLGSDSGYHDDQIGTVTDCVIIGADSFTTASNAIVIGTNSSAGAGEISIGNTTHDTVQIHGILEQATEPSNANQLWDSGGYVMLSDGAARSRFFETYAAGTAYTLTATAAAAVFGTTSPVIVLDQVGTYRVYGMAVIEYIGATFAANQAVTLTLRRTNNTAANLTSGTIIHTLQIVTTLTGTAAIVNWEAAAYTTANTTDSLTIFADVAVLPSAGRVDLSQSFIKAERLP